MRVQSRLIAVIGGGGLAAEIVAALRAAAPTRDVVARDSADGLDDLAACAFIVGIAENGVTAPLHRINRFACTHGIPWLPVRGTPDIFQLGPTVLPGVTACLLCTDIRVAANGPNPPAPFPTGEGGAVFAPSLLCLLAKAPYERGLGGEVPTLVALEVLHTLIGEASRAHGHLGLLDRQSDMWTWHPVLRHPRCPACGGLPWSSYATPSHFGDGAEGVASFVDDQTGIVRAVFPVPSPPDELEPPHVAMAFLGNTQFRDSWAATPLSEQTTTGKGWTAQDAERAAIGEALERYCATLPPSPGRFVVATRHALDRPAIGPAAFGLYHPVQYANRSVPYAPVDDTTILHWVAGSSLTHDHPVLVPASLVYLLPLDTFCAQTSNGLAAGYTWHEAALRALCEVVERDAFLFTWLTMQSAPLLNLMAAGELVAGLVRHYAEHGVLLTAHDLTTTTGLPVVMARAHDARGRPPIDLIGLGCDPDPCRAVERAVLEVVQGRRARWGELAVVGTPASIRTPSDHGLWYALADNRDTFAFLGVQSGPLPVPVGIGEGADVLLASVVASLARSGHEAIIVDITTPDVRAAGMVVVRALVTGLLPIHFGTGQERLGSARLTGFAIDDLNRAPHPLA